MSYDISQIDLPRNYQYGEVVYVSLVEKNGIWINNGVFSDKPDGVFIKGRISSGWRGNVQYGIEEFFIPEASGRDVQIDDTYSARVAIDGNGNARVVEILRYNEPVDFRYERPVY